MAWLTCGDVFLAAADLHGLSTKDDGEAMTCSERLVTAALYAYGLSLRNEEQWRRQIPSAKEHQPAAWASTKHCLHLFTNEAKRWTKANDFHLYIKGRLSALEPL